MPGTIAGLLIVKTSSEWVVDGFDNLNFMWFGFGNDKLTAGSGYCHPCVRPSMFSRSFFFTNLVYSLRYETK